MRVRFLVDFRGVLTGERFYPAGTVADLPTGEQLVREGRAVSVEAPEPEPEPTPKAVVKRTRRAKK